MLGVYFSINIRQGWLPPDSGVKVWERWKSTYFIFLYLSWCLSILPWASISDLAAAAAAVLLLWKIKEKLNKHMKTSTVTLSVWHLMVWTSVSLPEIISDNCFSNYSLDIPTSWVLHHKQHEWKTFLCKGMAHGITGYWWNIVFQVKSCWHWYYDLFSLQFYEATNGESYFLLMKLLEDETEKLF